MSGNTSSERLFCLIIVAAFLPPLAVGIDYGCSGELCVNILFSLIPLAGFIHAVYLLVKKRDRVADEECGNNSSYAFPQNGKAQESKAQNGQVPQHQGEVSQQQGEAAQHQGQDHHQEEPSQVSQPNGETIQQEFQDEKIHDQSEQAAEKLDESVPEYQPPSHSPPEAYSKMQQQ